MVLSLSLCSYCRAHNLPEPPEHTNCHLHVDTDSRSLSCLVSFWVLARNHHLGAFLSPQTQKLKNQTHYLWIHCSVFPVLVKWNQIRTLESQKPCFFSPDANLIGHQVPVIPPFWHISDLPTSLVPAAMSSVQTPDICLVPEVLILCPVLTL